MDGGDRERTWRLGRGGTAPFGRLIYFVIRSGRVAAATPFLPEAATWMCSCFFLYALLWSVPRVCATGKRARCTSAANRAGHLHTCSSCPCAGSVYQVRMIEILRLRRHCGSGYGRLWAGMWHSSEHAPYISPYMEHRQAVGPSEVRLGGNVGQQWWASWALN